MLQDVKSHLGVTWSDEDTKIQNMIDRGKSIISGLAGVELDYQNNGQARHLLLEWCRYAYNNASEYFEENFQSEIMRLQLDTGISEINVSLDDISIGDLELSPEFDSTITDYTVTTTAESHEISVEPYKPNADITITVNSETIENNTSYSWQSGDNTVEVTVSHDGNSRTYTVVVTYEG